LNILKTLRGNLTQLILFFLGEGGVSKGEEF